MKVFVTPSKRAPPFLPVFECHPHPHPPPVIPSYFTTAVCLTCVVVRDPRAVLLVWGVDTALSWHAGQLQFSSSTRFALDHFCRNKSSLISRIQAKKVIRKVKV